jgi:tetratricopeptide (TPR) repeat protein
MIADHPLWGAAGNFQENYAAYKLPQASETVADPHNFLLEIWANAGTPAIVLLLAMAVAFALDLSRAPHEPDAESADSKVTGGMPIFLGALAGLLVGYVAAYIVGFPLESLGSGPIGIPLVWLIGMPLFALCWWVFDPWAERGALPLGAAIVALLVLLVNLLAAGAVIFPGVMATALVLVPVALCLARDHGAGAGPPASHRLFYDLPLSGLSRSLLAFAAVILAIACLWTEYQPVLGSRLHMLEATLFTSQGEGSKAEQAALEAATADPWSPEPWRVVAALRMQRYAASGENDDWQAFAEAAEKFRMLQPRHHGQFFERGNWFLIAWRKGGRREYLDQALAAYQNAIARYPAHALYHGQLAWTLKLAGRDEEAEEAARRATELDQANPHADRKLSRYHIIDPRISGSRLTLTRPETAEQTVAALRTTTEEPTP